MKITATEIREKTFEKNFRGYDKDEVTNFLTSLSKDWEMLLEEKAKLEVELSKAQAEANKLKQVEESLFRTLKTAEDTGASIIEEASTAADEIMSAAKENSEGMLKDAQRKADKILALAEMKSKEILEGIKADVTGMIRNYEHLIAQRDLILRNLQKLTEDIQDDITVSNETFKKVNLSIYEEMVQNFAKPKTAIILPDEEVPLEPEVLNSEEEVAIEVNLNVDTTSPEITKETEEVKTESQETTEATITVETPKTLHQEVEEKLENPPIEETPKQEEEASTEDPKKKGGSFFDQFD
ncbi:DivIVA domain-containing protein [Mongoliitalea daihaiensis]|uniref:DivIVA domain-containing protein n=1 Tax=Mongoliitalea daihaiensis TaxID=2782006 RepID=UPI001F35515E|nr:DivIVA domain-containing protein [Mongoliitalea daihaiensis]UJP64684.1 DivIVA domain-containing protein [Mongoliitalea daihaiensis]